MHILSIKGAIIMTKCLIELSALVYKVGVMLVNKYAKYESNMSRDNENNWGSTKTLTFAR